MDGLKKTDYLNCSFTSKIRTNASVSLMSPLSLVLLIKNFLLSVVWLTLSQVAWIYSFTLGNVIKSQHVQG